MIRVNKTYIDNNDSKNGPTSTSIIVYQPNPDATTQESIAPDKRRAFYSNYKGIVDYGCREACVDNLKALPIVSDKISNSL